MRALVLEDEPLLREQIATRLRGEGFVIDEAGTATDGLWVATSLPIDIAVVDLGLPDEDGITVIRRLREAGQRYPVLILTARDRWQDKVEGLEAGADDYLAKPFHLEELLARLRALLRRSGGWADARLRFERLEIDPRSQIVEVDGRPVTLTAFEYRVLIYLATHAGEVLTKARLLDHLYDEDTDRDPNVLEVFVRRLRRKLDPDGSLDPIETLRGRGYRLALARRTDL